MGYRVVVQLGPNGQMTTPRLDDSARDHRYLFATSNLAADRTVTFPLLAANANFVFDSFLNVFTVAQQFNAGIQMATSAILLDTLAGAGARIQDGGAETVAFRDSTDVRGLEMVLTAGGVQTFGTSAGGLVVRTVGTSALDLQTNSVTRLSFSGGGGGAATFTQGAASGGAVALTITPGAHTAVLAEVNTILLSAQTITITGAYATQRFAYLSTPTITAASGLTVTTATTFEIQSAPQTAGSAAITATYAFNISGGALNINNIAGSSYRAIRTGAHTVTLTTATQVTATPSIAAAAFNIITVAQSGGAVTVDSVATVYIAGAPTAGAGVTLTSAYAILIESAGAIGFDTRANGGVRMQDGGAEVLFLRDSTNVRGLNITLTAAGAQTITASGGDLILSTTAGNDVLIGDDVTLLYVDGGVNGGIGGIGIGQIAQSGSMLVAGWNAYTMAAGTTAARHFYIQGNVTELAGAAITDIVGAYFNTFTVTDGGGAETVGILATVYINNAPTAGTTPTNGPYAFFVDAGTARFDGRIEGGPAVTSLTLAGSVTGAAPLQRDVVIQTGNAANPQVLVTRMTFGSNAAIGASTITSAERLIVNVNSAASAPSILLDGTWFTGGSATTTKPHILIEPTGTTSTGWSTGGTGLGINGAAGFVGNLLDLQVNARRLLSVSLGAFINGAGDSVFDCAGVFVMPSILMNASTFIYFRNASDGNNQAVSLAHTNGVGIQGLNINTTDGLRVLLTAKAGGSTALTITHANHTSVITEQPALTLSTASITLTDTTTIARYGWAVINAPTFVGVAGGGAEVITEAASLVITGAPIQGADISLTNASAILLLTAGAICFDSRANGGVRMYDGGAEVLNFFDSTNARGITFTLTAAGVQTIGTSAGNLVLTPITQFNNKLYPATDAAALQTATGIYAGTGAPNNANGANNDFYFQGDGTQAGNTVIWHKEAGAWVALITT